MSEKEHNMAERCPVGNAAEKRCSVICGTGSCKSSRMRLEGEEAYVLVVYIFSLTSVAYCLALYNPQLS